MQQQHQPDIICLNYERSIHPAQYNKHYSACCKLNDEKIVNARHQQIIDLDIELNVEDSELVLELVYRQLDCDCS